MWPTLLKIVKLHLSSFWLNIFTLTNNGFLTTNWLQSIFVCSIYISFICSTQRDEFHPVSQEETGSAHLSLMSMILDWNRYWSLASLCSLYSYREPILSAATHTNDGPFDSKTKSLSTSCIQEQTESGGNNSSAFCIEKRRTYQSRERNIARYRSSKCCLRAQHIIGIKLSRIMLEIQFPIQHTFTAMTIIRIGFGYEHVSVNVYVHWPPLSIHIPLA